MEFNFADSLFDFADETSVGDGCMSFPSYTPKQCVNRWFTDVSANHSLGEEEYCFILKYQADLLYHRQHFSDALQKYEEHIQCDSCLKNQNMSREAYDSIVRCCVKLNMLDLAESKLERLFELHGNSNDCSVSLLAFNIYLAKGMFKDAVKQLKQVIDINTTNPEHWLSFFQLLDYLHKEDNIFIDIDSGTCFPTDELLYALLLQARFFLNEALRGQGDEKKSQYELMSLDINNMLNAVLAKDVSLEERVKLQFYMPADGGQDGCRGRSFFRNWLTNLLSKS